MLMRIILTFVFVLFICNIDAYVFSFIVSSFNCFRTIFFRALVQKELASAREKSSSTSSELVFSSENNPQKPDRGVDPSGSAELWKIFFESTCSDFDAGTS